MRRQITAFALALTTAAAMHADAAEPLKILDCRASGPSELGERVVDFKIIPPRSSERLNLWTLTKDHQPDQLVKSGVARGEIQIDYGSRTERHDLVFLRVGNTTGSSHVAFWLRAGIFQHPNFVIVDIWDPDIPVHLTESVEPQPYLTGNCTR